MVALGIMTYICDTTIYCYQHFTSEWGVERAFLFRSFYLPSFKYHCLENHMELQFLPQILYMIYKTHEKKDSLLYVPIFLLFLFSLFLLSTPRFFLIPFRQSFRISLIVTNSFSFSSFENDLISPHS